MPDIVGVKKGLTEEQLCVLPPELRNHAAYAISSMLEAARMDWPGYLPVSGDIDLGWVRAFDEKYDARYLSALLQRADAASFGNELIIACCEFGAVLGQVLQSMRPSLIWAYDFPYWDSWLYSSEKGLMINVFSWSMKKFSSYGVNDGYGDKLIAAANMV